MNQALEGIRVVDLAQQTPGPLCSRLLADLGATVIKIEPPGGEWARKARSLYRHLNSCKTVVELDLKTPAGLAAAREHLEAADVVLEGFRPGVADRLGVGFNDVAALSPQIIYCSISGYGQSGPMRDVAGHDMCYHAHAGAFSAELTSGEGPNRPLLPNADLASSLFGAFMILAALRDPDRVAQHIDVSMQDVCVFLAFSRWGEALTTGRDSPVEELLHLTPGNDIYRTADGEYITVCAVEDKFWVNLCTALTRPDLAEPPFDSTAGRMAARTQLNQQLSLTMGALACGDLLTRFVEADVPAMRVRRASEVLNDPALRASGLVRPVADGYELGFPVKISDRRMS